MPWAVFGDQEALDLLDASAEMAYAALEARRKRVDQDGVIERSYRMSQIKLQGLRKAFHSSPMIEWSEFDDEWQNDIRDTMSRFIHSKNGNEQDVLWKAIRTVMLRPGTKKPETGGSDPWRDDGLSRSKVAPAPTRPETKPKKVPSVRVKAGSRKAPPDTAT